MEIRQYSVYWVNLDPVIGSEVSKTRPCVIVSPDEMNKYLRTVIIAPITHTLKQYPSRVSMSVSDVRGMVMIDQLRTIDKTRLCSYIGKLKKAESNEVKSVINEMLC